MGCLMAKRVVSGFGTPNFGFGKIVETAAGTALGGL